MSNQLLLRIRQQARWILMMGAALALLVALAPMQSASADVGETRHPQVGGQPAVAGDSESHVAQITATLETTPQAAAAAADEPQSPAAAAGFRSFDAVTTVSQNNIWKHMALIGDEYAIFTDAGLVQGPTRIAFKWPFLPEEFTHDIDSAAVYFSGNGFRWQHRWTKGNRMITFEDSGIIREQTLPVGKCDAYAGFNYNGKYCCVFTMATYGDRYTAWMEQFPGQPIFGTEYPLALRFPYIPAHFTFDLDDISIESNGNAYSFYKGNERIIFDKRRVIEFVNLDRKWPFLNNWRSM